MKPCPSVYFDDFRDPSSGWPSEDNENMLLGYAGGEYRMLLRSPYWYVITRSGFKADEYTATVQVRNATGTMGSYGIAFGITEDWGGMYTLELYPDGWYGLYRYDPYGGYVWEERYSPVVHQGTATNEIKIERDNGSIKAYVNGTLLESVFDSTYQGMLYVGLINFSYSQSQVDALFDNYYVVPKECNQYQPPPPVPGEVQMGWMESALGDRIGQTQFDKHQP